MHFPGLEKSWILGIMHQSMLSPRVGGPGIPRGFDKISFPVGKDVRRVRFIWFISGVFALFNFLSCFYIVPLPNILASRLVASLRESKLERLLCRLKKLS